jgi:hypothetical protein
VCRKCREHIHRETPYNWVTQLNFEGKQETWKLTVGSHDVPIIQAENLTYIGKRLGFILGFRVGPWINRLVRANGPGKRECNRIEKRAMVRKPTGS